jgi:NOL1/NOP2/fmu family ribosome biogenesis protein
MGDGGSHDDGADTAERTNDGQRFDRLPATPAERQVPGRPSRQEVLDWWDERFGIDPETFDDHSFWEKGAGKVWAFSGDVADPAPVEALGLTFLRTRQEHWKPTTTAAFRFGEAATRNRIELDADAAARFVRGEDQEVAWDGDWGYLIATQDLGGDQTPLGVGLYLYGELRSRVPKGYQQPLEPLSQ